MTNVDFLKNKVVTAYHQATTVLKQSLEFPDFLRKHTGTSNSSVKLTSFTSISEQNGELKKTVIHEASNNKHSFLLSSDDRRSSLSSMEKDKLEQQKSSKSLQKNEIKNTEPQGKTSIGKDITKFFASTVAKLKTVRPFVPIISSQRQENSLTVKQVNNFKMNKLQVCIDLLEQSPVKNTPKIIALRCELQNDLNTEQNINKKLEIIENQEAKADSEYILSAKSLVPGVVNKLAACLKKSRPELSDKQAKKEIKTQFKQCDINRLNNSEWNKITSQFSFGGQMFKSVLTPAAQMKSVGKHNIFETDYKGKGVCSADQKNTTHAVNLWTSEIFIIDKNGKETRIFAGVRHAVHSPYLLAKGSNERKVGAEQRAKEMVTAALFLDKDKLEKARKGQTVQLRVISTSLLAPKDILGSKEGRQLADQMAAYEALSSQKPLKLSLRDENGKLITVKINLDIAAFNFPVNERGLKLGFGIKTSDKYNQSGLTKLLGDLSPKAKLGGWVGNYLEGKPKPENAERVHALAKQLKTMLADKAHHNDAGDAYKAARVMILLAYEIGITPAFNCKSGKDRTGMLDAEIKREVVFMHQAKDKLPSKPGPLDASGSKLLQAVLLHSGNLEIQEQNTGAEGNKVLGKHRLRDILGLGLSTRQKRIINQQVADQARGLSGLV
ncbi:inositol phosphate phosphatase SopB [Candidatus Fukatsuia endosymbiont of Tuberolachnus salignus]|uniref:inositol phosphate phosphatase SopB n=1 Tax=Candidatus Fukatsuia endosymbiont of Tuberolachnus salignus TaxID=3077957 RepID=UPI00313C30D6